MRIEKVGPLERTPPHPPVDCSRLPSATPRCARDRFVPAVAPRRRCPRWRVLCLRCARRLRRRRRGRGQRPAALVLPLQGPRHQQPHGCARLLWLRPRRQHQPLRRLRAVRRSLRALSQHSGLGTIGEYGVFALMPQVRLRYPLFRGRLVPYVIGGAGVAFTDFNDRKTPSNTASVPSPPSA